MTIFARAVLHALDTRRWRKTVSDGLAGIQFMCLYIRHYAAMAETNFTRWCLMNESIPQSLQKYITTRDKRIAKLRPWSPSEMSDQFAKLLNGETINYGGRASCGGKVDPTWVAFTTWNEIVRKARSLGYPIKVDRKVVGNSWATKSGGFWDENDYSIPRDQEEK